MIFNIKSIFSLENKNISEILKIFISKKLNNFLLLNILNYKNLILFYTDEIKEIEKIKKNLLEKIYKYLKKKYNVKNIYIINENSKIYIFFYSSKNIDYNEIYKTIDNIFINSFFKLDFVLNYINKDILLNILEDKKNITYNDIINYLKYLNYYEYYTRNENDKKVKVFNKKIYIQIKKVNELKNILNNTNNFIINIQPIFDIYQKIEFNEILIRCKYNNIIYSPNDFLPLISKIGLLDKLDYFIITTMINKLQEWDDKGYILPNVSINLTNDNLVNEIFIKKLLKDFEKTNEKYLNKISLEILEDKNIYEDIGYKNINKLKNFVDIIIDDYGTGYSNLERLIQINPSKIKVDRTLIKDLKHENNFKKEFVLKSILDLSFAINADVVIEGIETKEELAKLINLNFKYFQGFFFERPITLEEYERKYLIKKI